MLEELELPRSEQEKQAIMLKLQQESEMDLQIELDELSHKEQVAHAAMREASRRKQELLTQLDEEARAAAQLRRDQVAALAAELKEQYVLGVSYDKLRKRVDDYGLRIVSVHRDVRVLLAQALPSVDEQHFSQLVTALVESLVYQNTYVKPAVEALRASSDSSHYFERGAGDVSIPIVAKGRYVYMKCDAISDAITAYALAWGQATNYEGNQADV